VKKDRLGPTSFTRLVLNIKKMKIHQPPSPHSRRRSAAIEAIVAIEGGRERALHGLPNDVLLLAKAGASVDGSVVFPLTTPLSCR
jgi:hypothetical protein